MGFFRDDYLIRPIDTNFLAAVMAVLLGRFLDSVLDAIRELLSSLAS